MRSSGLTPELAANLYGMGQSQSDIAADFGVSQPWVSKLIKQAGYRTPREKVLDHMPWSVRNGDLSARQAENAIHYRLKDHLVFIFGVEMSEDKRNKLRKFYDGLQRKHQVIKFDPKYMGSPYNECGGFEYVDREESDEDLIIRVDQNTRVKAEDRPLWAFPIRMP